MASQWSSAAFSALTSKATTHIFPPHTLIPNFIFIGISQSCCLALYALLISPFPRSVLGKQLLALPLILILLLHPMYFTCPNTFAHLNITSIAITIATRMTDIYLIQPWTGIQSRYHSSRPSTAALKKNPDVAISSSTSRGFLHWDLAQLRVEIWAPIRKVTTDRVSKAGLAWYELLPQAFLYIVLMDSVIFFLSFFRIEDLPTLSDTQELVLSLAVGVFIILTILVPFYSVAIFWSFCTGQRVDPQEWTMLQHPLPIFALTPVEFWSKCWHSLFRCMWVDVGFLPTKRFCRRYLGRDRVGAKLARVLEQAMPLMAVFALSGLLHGYIVYTYWRAPMWSQWAYFLIQCLAFLLTKAISETFVGRWLQQRLESNNPWVRGGCRMLGMTSMFGFHLMTAPLFTHPFTQTGEWNGFNQYSLLWQLFGER